MKTITLFITFLGILSVNSAFAVQVKVKGVWTEYKIEANKCMKYRYVEENRTGFEAGKTRTEVSEEQFSDCHNQFKIEGNKCIIKDILEQPQFSGDLKYCNAGGEASGGFRYLGPSLELNGKIQITVQKTGLLFFGGKSPEANYLVNDEARCSIKLRTSSPADRVLKNRVMLLKNLLYKVVDGWTQFRFVILSEKVQSSNEDREPVEEINCHIKNGASFSFGKFDPTLKDSFDMNKLTHIMDSFQLPIRSGTSLPKDI